MKKAVPDPPRTTTLTPFNSCQGMHPPLFAVREGIEMEYALIHLSRLLEAALDSNLQACQLVEKRTEALTWATQQSLEMGLALLESLLKR